MGGRRADDLEHPVLFELTEGADEVPPDILE